MGFKVMGMNKASARGGLLRYQRSTFPHVGHVVDFQVLFVNI